MADPSVKPAAPASTTDAVDSDDDDIALPSDTLAILQQFLRDKAEAEEQLTKTGADGEVVEPKPFKAFEENWVRKLVT